MADKTVKVLISGRVQGVYFRANTAKMATPLGLEGFVRNLPDGRVEAVFKGPEDAVEKAVQWCHKGTGVARVDKVEIMPDDTGRKHGPFGILY